MNSEPTLSTLVRASRSGDKDVLEQLTPLVYDELRRIASRHLQSERSGHTLQATALVNEAFLRLSKAELDIQDRAHFLALAARTMRRVLADYGRARRSQKRGSGQAPITLHEELVADDGATDIVDIDDALCRLELFDERKCDVLVLHYFGGLTFEETAEALGISTATVDRDLRFAKAWLANELQVT